MSSFLLPSSAPWAPPTAAARPCWLALATVAILVTSAVPRPASAAGAALSAPRPVGSVQDDGGLLGRGPVLAILRDRVIGAATRAGLPIAIVLVGTAGSSRQIDPASLEQTARTRFAEQGLADGADDAVLLLVAPRAAQSVLETGKGEAGIVPEIDARRITADLRRALRPRLSATALAGALAKTVDQIADSALETRERRRPLSAPPPDERAEASAPSSRHEGPRAPVGTRKEEAKSPPRRSLVPGAYALAIFVMLGLALRQRRRSNSRESNQATRRS